MSNKCHYSVVRYVPDDLRDEAVNVGVILEAETVGDGCLTAFASNWSRAAHIDPSLQRPSVDRLIDAFRDRLADQCRHQRLSELVRYYAGGRIQLTAPRFCIAADVQHELAQLKRQFIVDLGPQRELGLTEPRLISDVRDVLKKELSTFPDNVIRFKSKNNPILFAGKSGRHEFDIEFRSPVRTDLIRCITFDVKSYSEKIDEAKVLTFDYRDILDAGRNQNVGVLSVLYPPRHPINGSQSAFESAQKILEGHHVATYDFSREADRAGLATIARTRIAEAA